MQLFFHRERQRDTLDSEKVICIPTSVPTLTGHSNTSLYIEKQAHKSK